MLVGTMSVFTRELLDLLKDTPKCLLPFSQFIPSYHRRYGRQCRVSDYGYTKLLDLLESLPHILQVSIFFLLNKEKKKRREICLNY